MVYFWRVLLVLYVVAVVSLAYGLYVERGMGAMLFAYGIMLLSLPWSAVTLLGVGNPTVADILSAVLVIGPLINVYLLWRLSRRRAPQVTAAVSPTPEIVPATESAPASGSAATAMTPAKGEERTADLDILWWLILVPACVVLAVGWATYSRSSPAGIGIEIGRTVLAAQLVTLINCTAFFREQLPRRAMIRWSITSSVAAIVLSALLPLHLLAWHLQMLLNRITGTSTYLLAPNLHLLLWISLLGLLYIVARKRRRRRIKRDAMQ